MCASFNQELADHRVGSHRYIYGAEVNFHDLCVKYIQPPGDGTRYLHVYCDHLLWGHHDPSNEPTIELRDPKTDTLTTVCYVHIHARTLWKDLTSNDHNWTFRLGKAANIWFSIDFFFEDSAFNPTFTTSNGPDDRFAKGFPLRVNADDTDNAGVMLFVVNIVNESMQNWLLLPELYALQLRRAWYSDSGDRIAAFDNSATRCLFQLLRTMLAVALEKMTGDDTSQREAISYLRFIVRCSRYSQDQSKLCSDARALLAILELPRRFPLPLAWSSHSAASPASKFLVPDLVLSSYVDHLNRAISLMDKLESTRDSIMRFGSLEALQRQTSMSNLEAIAAIAPGGVDNTLNASRAVGALYEADRTRIDLESKQPRLEEKKAAFQKSFQDFTEAQKKDIMIALFTDALALGVGVVAAVATSGAGAALTKANFQKVLQDLNNTGVTKFSRLKSIISNLAEKGPALVKALKAGAASFDRNRELASTFGTEKQGEQMQILQSKLAAGPVDQIAIIEQWEEFKLDVDTAFYEMDQALGLTPEAGSYARDPWDKTKAALRDFKNEMLKCAVRGQAVLAQQRVVAELVQTYYSGRAISQVFEERAAKIKSMKEDLANHIRSDGFEGTKQQQALQQLDYELAVARLSASTCFNQTVVSYMYMSGSKSFPNGFTYRVDKTSLQYGTDRDTLIGMTKSAEAEFKNLQDMQRDPVFSTDDRAVFAEDWRSEFAFDRRVSFTIPYTLDIFNRWYRTRIHEPVVRVWYTDPADPTKAIELSEADYQVELGPQFMDNSHSGEIMQYWIKPYRVSKVTGRAPERKNVWNRDLYILPTIPCAGSIAFMAPSKPTDAVPTEQEKTLYDSALKREPLLAAICKIELTLICEGVSR